MSHVRKMKMNCVIGAVLSLLTGIAHADIVCEGQTDNYGPAKVEISPTQVRVSGAGLSTPRVFKNLSIANGLITAPGLAVRTENHFGCVRNALIITDFREPIGAGYMGILKVDTCTGGSTPDNLCLD